MKNKHGIEDRQREKQLRRKKTVQCEICNRRLINQEQKEVRIAITVVTVVLAPPTCIHAIEQYQYSAVATNCNKLPIWNLCGDVKVLKYLR